MSQKNLNINDYYATSDLALVTVISLWYPIEVINRTNPSKAEFLFKRDEGLDKLVESYWRRELQIEPQSFFSQLKIIKSRLYGER